jgi:hypothetical protein
MEIIRAMTLGDWANLSTIGQFVLVSASLFVIWYQLRQGVRLTKAANSQSLAEQAGAFNALLIQSSEVAKIWYTYGDERKLEAEEFKGLAARERYKELLVQWLILHENIFYQHQRGLLDSVAYNSWASDLKATVAKHNLGVIRTPLEEVFCGDFGLHLVSLWNNVRARGGARELAATQSQGVVELPQNPRLERTADASTQP